MIIYVDLFNNGLNKDVRKLTRKLAEATLNLQVAMAITPQFIQGPRTMNPILQGLADQVTQTTTVMNSAVTLINGFSTRLQAAVDAALAGGATAEQLAPVQLEVDALRQSSESLAAAILNNTPSA